MININDKLNKRNIKLFLIGILLFVLSIFFVYLVGETPEGFMGLLAPLTMLLGIIVIVYSLLSNKN